MSAAENKELVRSIFAELANGNARPFRDSLADDVRWIVTGSTGWSRTYEGKPAVLADLLGPLRTRVSGGVRLAAHRLIAEGEYVVVEARGQSTTNSGMPYNNTYCFVCRVAGGKLQELTEYLDTELITKALGTPWDVDRADEEGWPELHLSEWKDSFETLHLWMQIVGKIRMTLTPLVNHWWNTTLYLTPRGLTTSVMPYRGAAVEMRFDFIDHKLIIETSWRHPVEIELRPQTSSDFYAAVMSSLRDLEIEVDIWPVTVEMPAVVRLDSDRDHSSYDREAVHRWWRIMLTIDDVFKEFRAKFIGKSSPVHFFWGGFDHAVTRFSGRRAPGRREGPLAAIMNEGYSHELISAGFWPGGKIMTGATVSDAAFYAYAAPQPEGFPQAKVAPSAAYYDTTFGEFLLMYDDVRRSSRPRQTLLDFLQSTYEAAANLAGWDRAALERR